MSLIKEKKLLLHGLKTITEENIIVQSCKLISFDINDGYDIKVVINGLELEFKMLIFEYYNAFNCKGGIEKIRECIANQIFDLEEEIESDEHEENDMSIMRLMKTKYLSWKKMHKRYGYDYSNDLDRKKWYISDDVKDDLEKYYPKWIMYNIDESGVHLVRKKDIIKRLKDNFGDEDLWAKLGANIVTINDFSTEDIWFEEARILLQGILKEDKIVSTQFYDFFIGYIISTDKLKWIELDLRRDITLREYWLSPKYKYTIDRYDRVFRKTELDMLKLKLQEYGLDYFKNFDFKEILDKWL